MDRSEVGPHTERELHDHHRLRDGNVSSWLEHALGHDPAIGSHSQDRQR